MKWLERTWTFDTPQEQFGQLLDDMSATASLLTTITQGKVDTVLRLKHKGAWSVHEHIGHLLTIESLWIARLDDFVLGNPTLRPWNGTNADTEAADFNRHRLGKLIEDFEDIRNAHVTMLWKLESQSSKMNARHERFDCNLRLVDHLYILTEHDKHHLAKINEILDTTL